MNMSLGEHSGLKDSKEALNKASRDVHNNPSDGCEIIYMQLELESEEALKKSMASDGPAFLLE